MIQSMTGFGRSEKNIAGFGIVNAEVRSINHKFLETVIHVPEGFIALEDKIKKEIETKIKRGRVTCVISMVAVAGHDVVINEQLVHKYLTAFKSIGRKFQVAGQVDINTLMSLPGVVALTDNKASSTRLWPQLRAVLHQALDELVRMRVKEGQALAKFLMQRNASLQQDLEAVKARFKKVVKDKLVQLPTDQERTSFLKESDINEEIERLDYHLKSFRSKLLSAAAVGKELDFISQEMQRETNTMGAKSCDAQISGKVVQIKSQIEKTREQLQNIV